MARNFTAQTGAFCACQEVGVSWSSSLVNGEKQAFLFAIARCTSQEFRPQGRPARVALEFSLMPGLNQKIMRVRRQFVQGSEVGYGRANIKEIWLKVGVDCVKPLVGRKKRVNLCGNWFYSLVPLQIGHGAERKRSQRPGPGSARGPCRSGWSCRW